MPQKTVSVQRPGDRRVNAGITEITASLPDLLRRIGKSGGGQTVVISFVKRTPLGYVPIVLRFVGQPGAELHSTQFQKIVRTLKPGERAFILDPRVQPYAVVNTKPVVVTMEAVEGNARNNIGLSYRGRSCCG